MSKVILISLLLQHNHSFSAKNFYICSNLLQLSLSNVVSYILYTHIEDWYRNHLLHWVDSTSGTRQLCKIQASECDLCDAQHIVLTHAYSSSNPSVSEWICLCFWYRSLKQIVYFWRSGLCPHYTCFPSCDCFSLCLRFFTKAWVWRSPFLDSSKLRRLSSGRNKSPLNYNWIYLRWWCKLGMNSQNFKV